MKPLTPEKALERLNKERGDLPMKDWYKWRYLKSDHWRTLRKWKLSYHPRCEICKAPAVQVHHLQYRNIYDVTPKDLQSVCRQCHAGLHGKDIEPEKPHWRTKPKQQPERPKQRTYEEYMAARRKKKKSKPKQKLTLKQQRDYEHLTERKRL